MNKEFLEKMKKLRPDLVFFDIEEEANRLPKIGSTMILDDEEVTVAAIIPMPNRHYVLVRFADDDTTTCYVDDLQEVES